MALADTSKAIGKVSKLLSEQLNVKTGLNIAVGRPGQAGNNPPKDTLNLFLYEALFDPSLKNLSLDEGQPAPLWLVLKYILTAFDDKGESDTELAHEYLGKGIQALQELSFVPLDNITFSDPEIPLALQDNPDTLKITFDETSADLLSKLMQGSDEKYRFSIGFQVRPVMIATAEPSSYALLVGVDYTQVPSKIIGEEGIKIPVLPSLGPQISSVSPSNFEVNDILSIYGNDLDLSSLVVTLGPVELAIAAQQPNKLECTVNGTIAPGGVISAGSHSLSVVQILPTGRRRSSNLIVGNLLPTLESVVVVPNTFVFSSLPSASTKVFGEIDLTGRLLSTATDDIFVALYIDGVTEIVMDEVFDFTVAQPPSPPVPPFSRIRLKMKEADAVQPGTYRVIFRVNGQQAKNSPELEIPSP